MVAVVVRWLGWAIFAMAKGRPAHGVDVRALAGGDGAVQIVHDALDLILRTRPGELRRFRRLVRRVLVIDERAAVGRFVSANRMVTLSLFWMHERARRAGVSPAASVAATLVHEAMHAHLRDLGVSRYEDESARLREERLCHRAAILFASRLPGAAPLARSLARDREAWTPRLFSNAARRARALAELTSSTWSTSSAAPAPPVRAPRPSPGRPRKRNFAPPPGAREPVSSSRPR